MSIKMQIEAEPMEFYRIVTALAALSPFGRVFERAASDDAGGPDVGQAVSATPSEAPQKKGRGRPKAATATETPASEATQTSPQDPEPSRPAEATVVATPEMAAKMMHRLFSEVSAQKATEVAIAIQGPKPGLSADTIAKTGTAQALYDRAVEELRAAGKSI